MQLRARKVKPAAVMETRVLRSATARGRKSTGSVSKHKVSAAKKTDPNKRSARTRPDITMPCGMLRNRAPQREEGQPVQEDDDDDTIVVSGCRGQDTDDGSDTIVVSGHRRRRSEDLCDEIIVSCSRSRTAGVELARSTRMGEQADGQNAPDRAARPNQRLEPQTAMNGVMDQDTADSVDTQQQSVSGAVDGDAAAGGLAGQRMELDDEVAAIDVGESGEHPDEEYAVGADEASTGAVEQRTDQDDALEGDEISIDHLREQASANHGAQGHAAAGELPARQTMQDTEIGREASALTDGDNQVAQGGGFSDGALLGPDGVQRQYDEHGHSGPRPTSETSTSSTSVAQDEVMSGLPVNDNVREGSSTNADVSADQAHDDSHPGPSRQTGNSIQQHVPGSDNAFQIPVTSTATTQEHLNSDTPAGERPPRGEHVEQRPQHPAVSDDRTRTRDAHESRPQRQRTDPGFIFSQKLYRLMHELAEEEWIDLLASVKEDAYGGRMLSLEMVPRTGLRPEPVAPVYPSATTTRGRRCGICLDDFDLVPDPVYLCRRCRFPVHIFCQARANFSDRVASRLPKCSNWYVSTSCMIPPKSILTCLPACSFGLTGLMSTARKGLTRRRIEIDASRTHYHNDAAKGVTMVVEENACGVWTGTCAYTNIDTPLRCRWPLTDYRIESML